MISRRNVWMVLLVLIPLSTSMGFGEKLGIRLRTSRIQSFSGSYNDTTVMSDYVNPGTSYGVGINHRITDNYSLEVGLDVGWMAVKKAFKSNPSKEPVFLIPSMYFTNFVHFPLGRVIPFVQLGVSIVPWKFTLDGPTGETAQFEGENFQKMSFAFHGGLGVEFRITDTFSMYGEGVFTYLFCRDQFFFGKGFTEQTILRLGGGLLFYPLH